MDIQNHFYGHSAVLAAWCGQPRTRHVAGLLQHGWVARSPVAVNFGDFPQVGAQGDPRRLLVWTHGSRAWQEDPARPTTPIGAPLLYLLRSRPWCRLDPVPAEGARPLIMPMHGTHVLAVDTDHAALARYYLETEGPATICLHAEDLERPSVRAAWSVGGNEIVSAGDRYDPLFLPRLALGMARASRVVTNRLATSVWYAAAVGRPSVVHGPRALMAGEDESVVRRLEETWPEVHGRDAAPGPVRELALAELGAQHLREPEELAGLLGWDGPGARALLDYYLGAPLQKAATVLGLRDRHPAAHGPAVPSESTATAQTPAVATAPRPIDFLRHPLAHLPHPLPQTRWQGQPVPWVRPAADGGRG